MITFYLFYLLWNTPIHKENPTLLPVLLTVYIILYVKRIYKSLEDL